MVSALLGTANLGSPLCAVECNPQLHKIVQCSTASLGGFSRGSESSPLIEYKVQVAERMRTNDEVGLFNRIGLNSYNIVRLC